jgi:uncharacterized protein involved in response to NO
LLHLPRSDCRRFALNQSRPAASITAVAAGYPTACRIAASTAIEIVYVQAVIAAVSRIAASLGDAEVMLRVAAFAWVAAFGGFVFGQGPMLFKWLARLAMRPRALT